MKGILLDPETGDLVLKRGMIAVGDTTDQIAEIVLKANKGEFKEYPLLGAEVYKQNNHIMDPLWCLEAKKMLNFCGLDVKAVTCSDNQLISLE